MQRIEPAESIGSEGLAVLIGAAGGPLAGSARALRARGHHTVFVSDPTAVLGFALAHRLSLVVAEAAFLARDPDPSLVAVLKQLHPDVRIVTLHDEGAPEEMWSFFSLGAAPHRMRVADELAAVFEAGSASGAAIAIEALRYEMQGRTEEACETLARLTVPDCAVEAIDALSAVGVGALERLRRRTRYLVPTELLVEHLPEHLGTLDGERFSLWWSMVEQIAFRAAGLQLPIRSLELEARHLEAVFGAFHAAGTLVRFTARRQWCRPEHVLDEVVVR